MQVFPKFLKNVSVFASVRQYPIYVNIGKLVILRALIIRLGKAVGFVSSSGGSDVLLCIHCL